MNNKISKIGSIKLNRGMDELEQYITLHYVSKEDEIAYLAVLESAFIDRRKMFGKNIINTLIFPNDATSYRKLPKRLRIYRGYNEAAKREGISWSLSQNVAEGFANVSQIAEYKNVPPSVVTGTCSLKDVIAYTNSCSEEEIIVNPKIVKGIKNIAVLSAPRKRQAAEPLDDLLGKMCVDSVE